MLDTRVKDIDSMNALERVKDFKKLTQLSVFVFLPLYLSFWICDYFYASNLRTELAAIRISVIPFGLLAYWIGRVSEKINLLQLNMLIFASVVSISIAFQVALIDPINSPYYFGFNIVLFGVFGFFPWTRFFSVLTIISIYLPLYIMVYLNT